VAEYAYKTFIMKVRNSISYRKLPPEGGIRFESNLLPSETVPEQSLTVRELLVRHSRGTLQDIKYSEPFYSEDMPDMRGLDIVERHQMLEDNKQLKKELEDKLKKAQTKKVVEPTVEPKTQTDATTSDSSDIS